MKSIFGEFEWGSPERSVLIARAAKERAPVDVGDTFRTMVDGMIHDLVLSSRADSTWKAYKAWVEVFTAF